MLTSFGSARPEAMRSALMSETGTTQSVQTRAVLPALRISLSRRVSISW